ncbi:hypothetical protein HLPCO_000526 [Haloplasma contractile SSD-17B]|uniref:Uncharacterized protein n=2 Tax=Haloplasma TaxID=471824 RepID=U2FMB3_9MOLU|nr:hypothetical protein HLPCO_000526 [Haloplasma contractile SSD-17B]
MYVDRVFTSQSELTNFLAANDITYKASPTTYLVQDGVVTNHIEGYLKIDSLNDFIESNLNQEQTMVVKNNLTEVVTAFENDEPFVLVLGKSYCSYCIEYKNKTLEPFLNQYVSFPLMYLYTDHQFKHSDKLPIFLETHDLTYEVSPTLLHILLKRVK